MKSKEIIRHNEQWLRELAADTNSNDAVGDAVESIYTKYHDHRDFVVFMAYLLCDDMPGIVKEEVLKALSDYDVKIDDKGLIGMIRGIIKREGHDLSFFAGNCLLMCTDLKWKDIPELCVSYPDGLKSRGIARMRKRFEKEGR